MLTKKNPLNETKQVKATTKSPSSAPEPKVLAKTYTTTAVSKKNTNCENQKKNEKVTTKISIQYDVGFPNQLFIRGQGAHLSWEKGVPLKNTKANEWIFETDADFASCEFKVLINDQIYEHGENRKCTQGANLSYTPSF